MGVRPRRLTEADEPVAKTVQYGEPILIVAAIWGGSDGYRKMARDVGTDSKDWSHGPSEY